MRTIISILLLVLLHMSTSAVEIKFGETQTDFKTDSVYCTKSDAILYLEHDSSFNNLYLTIYIGDSEGTLQKAAEIRWFGTITLPIEKGKYWKVEYNISEYEQYVRHMKIRSTPVIASVD